MPHIASKIPAPAGAAAALHERCQTLAQASSACTSATRRSQTLCASSSLGASTITRTSGSVPLGRTSTRPRPSSSSLGGVDRRVDVLGALQRAAVAHAHVDEPLRQLGHRVALAQIAAGERLHRQQCAGDAVAGAVEAHLDDVPGLLAAEHPVARAQLLEHVAVADVRDRHRHARLLHRRVKAVVGHHRHRHAVAVEPPAVAQVKRRERQQLVAVDDLPERDRPRARGRRRRRRRSRASWPPATTRSASASTCVEPQPALMLRPSGSSAITLTLRAQAAEDLRRDVERGAVGAVQQHVDAAQVELGEARVQLAQVVLRSAAQLAHAPDRRARGGVARARSACSIACSASSVSL